ncbi:MAG: hypothetical protein IPM69_09270 [Ignavibacteria bacterium]|nr:hypothetical protein [Ignavibacteria bacterium]
MKKTTEKQEQSTVQQLRDIRDKIGIEIQDMTYEQLMKYIEKKATLHPSRVWQDNA